MAKRKNKKLLAALAATLAVALCAAGTFAWISSTSAVANHFRTSTLYNNGIQVAETFTPPTDWQVNTTTQKTAAVTNTGETTELVRASFQELFTVIDTTSPILTNADPTTAVSDLGAVTLTSTTTPALPAGTSYDATPVIDAAATSYLTSTDSSNQWYLVTSVPSGKVDTSAITTSTVAAGTTTTLTTPGQYLYVYASPNGTTTDASGNVTYYYKFAAFYDTNTQDYNGDEIYQYVNLGVGALAGTAAAATADFTYTLSNAGTAADPITASTVVNNVTLTKQFVADANNVTGATAPALNALPANLANGPVGFGWYNGSFNAADRWTSYAGDGSMVTASGTQPAVATSTNPATVPATYGATTATDPLSAGATPLLNLTPCANLATTSQGYTDYEANLTTNGGTIPTSGVTSCYAQITNAIGQPTWIIINFDQDVVNLDGKTAESTVVGQSVWWYNPADGYFYWMAQVPGGASTGPIIDSVTYSNQADGSWAGMDYTLNVVASGVQNVSTAVLGTWNEANSASAVAVIAGAANVPNAMCPS